MLLAKVNAFIRIKPLLYHSRARGPYIWVSADQDQY
jgi:hypothetical protein